MHATLRGLIHGAAAGAAGTTALNTVSGLDAAVRGRGGSSAPVDLVAALAEQAQVSVPGNRRARSNRLAALGPLSGIATGVGLGAVSGALRSAGFAVPGVVGGPALGVAAMLATDVPLAVEGVSDPRDWTTEDWTADILPHLAYGVVTYATLAALTPRPEPTPATTATPARTSDEEAPRSTTDGLLRAAAIGAATGARSSAGLAAVALASPSTLGKAVTLPLAAVELGLDKYPATPSRLNPQGLVPRVVLSVGSAAALARRSGSDGVLAGLVASVSALTTAYAGLHLRAVAAERFDSDVPGAVIEDVLAGILGWWGVRRG